MNKKNNKKYMLVMLLLLVVGISIGYAALTTTLNINGATIIEKASWDIHFENLVKSDGSVTSTKEASIDSTKTLIEYTVMLAEPGDYYEFTVDMVNNGSIDAMISEVLKEGLGSEQEKYIEYTATYLDGVELEEKDYLKSGETQNIKVRVKYKEDIDSSDLPTEESAISLSFKVTYVQADDSAKEKSKLSICKRATMLHEDICIDGGCINQGYAENSKIIYGSLGTNGTLKSGDAFDCDVNGDGTYDGETERFYYVTDLETNNDYAVLIYYNNVAGGSASNTTFFEYNSDISSVLGPQTVMLELPTINQWKNVTLSNNIRNIKNNKDEIEVNNYNYSGYAARFVTIQELSKTCTSTITNEMYVFGINNDCNYLMENTSYSDSQITEGYWLETIRSNLKSYAWVLYGNSSSILTTPIAFDIEPGVIKSGARPVIEVLKTDISY